MQGAEQLSKNRLPCCSTAGYSACEKSKNKRTCLSLQSEQDTLADRDQPAHKLSIHILDHGIRDSLDFKEGFHRLSIQLRKERLGLFQIVQVDTLSLTIARRKLRPPTSNKEQGRE